MKKKGKGLSFDQKRDRMLAIFHKNKDVYNYQEVQKLSVKASIPFPSVKQILNSLKADGLVECEKIGAGVFYWSFPSKAYQIMKERYEATSKSLENLNCQNGKLRESIEAEKQKRNDEGNRSEMLGQVKQLRDEFKQLETEIQKYIRFDPERYQLLVKQNRELKNAVNEEIDNLEQIKKFIKKNQIGITNSEIEQNYDIPEELEEELS